MNQGVSLAKRCQESGLGVFYVKKYVKFPAVPEGGFVDDGPLSKLESLIEQEE